MKKNAVKRYVCKNTTSVMLKLLAYYAIVVVAELGGVFEAFMNISLSFAIINCAIFCVLPLFFKSTWYIFDHSWEGEIIEKQQEKYDNSNNLFCKKNKSFPVAVGKTGSCYPVTFKLTQTLKPTEIMCEKIVVKQKSGKTKIYKIPLREDGEILPYKVGDYALHIKGTPYLYNQTLAEKRGKNVCVICGKVSEAECVGCNLVVYG